MIEYTLIIDGKRRTFTSADKIEKTMGVTLDEQDRERLIRAARKGDVLYAAFNPFDSEMSAGEENPRIGILLATTQEELRERFYQLRDEI